MTRVLSGRVLLREEFDETLLQKELQELGLPTNVVRVTNPWYYRRKGSKTWIKVGESDARSENFAVRWDTHAVENGDYEILGLMHVFVKRGDIEHAIAAENVVDVVVKN
jgi:hypothetical protein